MSDTGQPNFISQREAARRWNIHLDTVRKLISDGRVTAYRLNNRIIRINVAELDACFREIPAAIPTKAG